MTGSVLLLTSMMTARDAALYEAGEALKGVPAERVGVGVDLDCCLCREDKVLAVWNFLFECNTLPVTYLTGRSRDAGDTVQDTLLTLWRLKFPWGDVFFKPSSAMKERYWKELLIRGALGEGATRVIPVVYLAASPELVVMHHQIMETNHVPHLSVWVDMGDPQADITLPTEVRVFRTR